ERRAALGAFFDAGAEVVAADAALAPPLPVDPLALAAGRTPEEERRRARHGDNDRADPFCRWPGGHDHNTSCAGVSGSARPHTLPAASSLSIVVGVSAMTFSSTMSVVT